MLEMNKTILIKRRNLFQKHKNTFLIAILLWTENIFITVKYLILNIFIKMNRSSMMLKKHWNQNKKYKILKYYNRNLS